MFNNFNNGILDSSNLNIPIVKHSLLHSSSPQYSALSLLLSLLHYYSPQNRTALSLLSKVKFLMWTSLLHYDDNYTFLKYAEYSAQFT